MYNVFVEMEIPLMDDILQHLQECGSVPSVVLTGIGSFIAVAVLTKSIVQRKRCEKMLSVTYVMGIV